jgi:predicted dehydrogenase
MNILLLGLGSIGQRHLRNIYKLNKKTNFFAIRKKFFTPLLTNKNKAINGNVEKKYKIKSFKNLDKFRKSGAKIDAAFICTPSKFHVDEAIWLIKNNINVFVEKPLGSSLKNINKLKKLIKSKPHLKCMMGYQLKFNPIILKLKDLIKSNTIGQIYNIFINHGEHINDFHPYEDYKNSYAARKELGGGVVLSQIHEIDYLLFLFEKYKVKIINTVTSYISDLKINVEDNLISNFLLKKAKKKTICTMYLNFFEKPKRREILLIGKKGKIECDLNKGKIKINKNNSVKEFAFKFDRNKIFIKQVKYFLTRVKSNKKIEEKYNILNGIKSLEISIKLKKNFL